jgi:hypothetical protein
MNPTFSSHQRAICLMGAVILGIDTSAATISDIKSINQIETSAPSGDPGAWSSAFFTQALDSTAFGPQAGFSGSVAAGVSASTTSSGSITVTGNSTSAGGWLDGNKIPLGVTLTFNASFTVSTPTPDSYLTLGPTTGNGIGITQTANTTGNIGVGEILNISAINFSSVQFTGAITEEGFDFVTGSGSIGNPRWAKFRSNNFNEGTAGMTATVGTDTWGFGTSAGTQASNLIIDNNYNATVGFETGGPMELSMQAGTWNLKGVGFVYDVSYDVIPVPEPATTSLALLGGLILFAIRRKTS